jgi:cell division topological specificity factor
LPQLKEDILKVIGKYVDIDPKMVDLTFEHKDDDISVLELNVKLPDDEK